jgi:hypothetical protein
LRPLSEIFSKIRARQTKAYNEEISKLCFFGEPTPEQKEKAFKAMDAVGWELLQKIDYKNHPQWKIK